MTNKLTSTQKEELIDQIRQQVAIANVQELLKMMTEKCFKKCVYKPGASLDSSETKCINLCADRFIDSWNLVTRSYTSVIKNKDSLNFS